MGDQTDPQPFQVKFFSLKSILSLGTVAAKKAWKYPWKHAKVYMTLSFKILTKIYLSAFPKNI